MIHRREFLKNTVLASAALSLGAREKACAANPGQGYKKALITAPPDEAILTKVKEAGFDGVEANLWGQKDKVTTPEEAAAAKEIADKLGMRIHTVLRGWAQFNSEDPAVVRADLHFTKQVLKAAQAYGSDAILIVPAKIEGMSMPGKKEYAIEFEADSGKVTRLVEGDNSSFESCIAAHNRAWETSKKALQELVPVAEETGVVLAVENVWNNLFQNPEYFAAFVDSIGSEWVKVYFDVANHIAYGPPAQDWIKVLGDRIVKVHIKDYADSPPAGGSNWPDLREGDVNFPEVMKALEQFAHYEGGWLTIEGSGGLAYEEQNKRLETIIAGK
jgi:hexulose-6-phosphate isomerase